jgi:hypothetical protein
MIHQYDSHYSEPSYWIGESKARDRYQRGRSPDEPLEYTKARLAFRGVAASTNERTLISAILPPRVFAEIQLPVADNRRARIDLSEQLCLLAMFNSFCLDWVIRLKVGTRLSNFYIYQLPVPRLAAGDPYFEAIVPRAARLTCTTPEFAALWQEVMGEPWDAAQAATNPTERQALRDELDALVVHLYGLGRDDFEHILGAFPLVFANDDAGQTKKEALLAVYDRFAPEVKDWPRS